MAGDYNVIISKASTGSPLAELPLSGLTFSRRLGDFGQLTGSLSINHRNTTESILGLHTNDSDREISVYRNDKCKWNGPVTNVAASLSGKTVDITAREAFWHLLAKRTLEVSKNYTGWELLDAVRDLVTYAKTKTATGDDGMTAGDPIGADFPRSSVDTTTSAVTLGRVLFKGHLRPYTIQQCFDFLANDPTTGFEWCGEYRTSSTRTQAHRKLLLGSPSLGTVLTTKMTEQNLRDYGRTCDWENAATRVHVIGDGYRVTLQNTDAVADGIQLSEVIVDLSDTSDPDFIRSFARDLRRRSRPPVRTRTATFKPQTNALEFDFADLGDTVPFDVSRPNVLSLSSSTSRVVEVTTRVANDGLELQDLTFNQPLSELGA